MYLENKPNGVKVKAITNTTKEVVLKIDSSLYIKNFIEVGQTGKNVMLAILKYMDNDTNLIQIGGDTLKLLVGHTGYSSQVIRNHLRCLYPMLERTVSIRGEYIVNPIFAYKGYECEVWEVYCGIERERGNVDAEGVVC